MGVGGCGHVWACVCVNVGVLCAWGCRCACVGARPVMGAFVDGWADEV